jgi:hypothetical protein
LYFLGCFGPVPVPSFDLHRRSSAEAQCAIFVQQGVNPLTLWEPLLSNLWSND